MTITLTEEQLKDILKSYFFNIYGTNKEDIDVTVHTKFDVSTGPTLEEVKIVIT